MKPSLFRILLFASALLLAASACPPLDWFNQFATGGGSQADPDDPFAPVEQGNVYTGAFTPTDTIWTVTENRVEITIHPESGVVTGTGRQVHVYVKLYEIDPGETITYNFEFSGDYDPDSGVITGQARIWGDKFCTSNCDGVDNYDIDFPTTWTGTLSDDGRTLWGTVEGMGGYSGFEAKK